MYNYIILKFDKKKPFKCIEIKNKINVPKLGWGNLKFKKYRNLKKG